MNESSNPEHYPLISRLKNWPVNSATSQHKSSFLTRWNTSSCMSLIAMWAHCQYCWCFCFANWAVARKVQPSWQQLRTGNIIREKKNTAQYSIVQPCTAQNSPVRPSTAQYSSVQPSITQYNPAPPSTAQYNHVQLSIAQSNNVQECSILSYSVH